MKTKNPKEHVYAVILAGGSGTRFWPLSRRAQPKQFINILGKESLFQQTIRRILPQIKRENIVILTSQRFASLVSRQTRPWGIPQRNILLEPDGRNTAPSICWAAAWLQEHDPAGVMAVLPSDHLILQKKNFIRCLRRGIHLAQQGFLVTLGIVPTRPETGYGYLQTKKIRADGQSILKVAKFTEKPSLNKARQFIRNKNYFWNSGMFVWQSTTILLEFAQHLPEVYELFAQERREARLRSFWPRLPSISIDYGILEKSDNVVAVPAGNIGWSDLGSWESLWELLKKDRKGNIAKGKIINLEGENNLLWGEKRLIAAIGLKDIVLVDTPDALLVCRKDLSQQVRLIIDQLKQESQESYL